MDDQQQAELIASIGDRFKTFLQDEIERDNESKRLTQISLARRDLQYWTGNQYLKPRFDSASRVFEYAPVSPSDRRSTFQNVWNVYKSDGSKLKAVVGQRQPNVRCVADDSSSDDNVQLAQYAEEAKNRVHRIWKLQRRMEHIIQDLWCVSAVFGKVEYHADGVRFGYSKAQRVEIIQKVDPEGYKCVRCQTKGASLYCPACGLAGGYEAAQVTEEPEYHEEEHENGEVDLTLRNALTTYVSYEAPDLDSTDYLVDHSLVPSWTMTAMFPELGKKDAGMNGGLENSAMLGLQAARAANNPAFVASIESLTECPLKMVWLKPTTYNFFGPKTRQKLIEGFRDGCVAKFVGGELVRIEADKLTERWAVCVPPVDKNIMCDPIGRIVIPYQDSINRTRNMSDEIMAKSIPLTLIPSGLLSRGQNDSRVHSPGELIDYKMNAFPGLNSAIVSLPRASIPEQMPAFEASQRAQMQEADNIQPAIFGGGPADTTWRATNSRKNQALMGIAPVFVACDEFAADLTRNGLRELGKWKVDPQADPNSGSLTYEALLLDGYHVEAFENAPQTRAEKVDRMADISKENPQLAQALGMYDPLTSPQLKEFFGVPEFSSRNTIDADYAHTVIRLLGQADPVQQPGPPGPIGPDGQPAPSQMIEAPSVQPDPFVDANAAFLADVVRQYLQEQGLQLKQADQRNGTRRYDNVKLYGQALQALIPPPPQAQGPPARGQAAPAPRPQENPAFAPGATAGQAQPSPQAVDQMTQIA